MAYGTRGKLKEELTGIHNNFDWIQKHSQKCLGLIQDHNPKLSKAFRALFKGAETLDKLAQDIYSKL
jgi:hypothetical protein